MTKPELNPNDIVVTGFGMVHPLLEDNDDLINSDFGNSNDGKLPANLNEFKPAPHLKDKRVMKAVSHRDGVGLVAVERLWENIEGEAIENPPFRRGFFVGASPSLVSDYENYREAVMATQHGGDEIDESQFGAEVMNSRPTTLLFGLPNNVLCYGSMRCRTQGPNNNFTSGAISSLVAIGAALRNFQRERIDFAIVGGYGYPSDQFLRGAQQIGQEKTSDSAIFCSLETRASAEKRNNKSLASISAVASCTVPGREGQQPEQASSAMKKVIEMLCQKSELKPEEIDAVFIPGDSSTLELSKNVSDKLSMSSTSWLQLDGYLGDMKEASGLVELIYAATNIKFKENLKTRGPLGTVAVIRNGKNGEWIGYLARLEA
jgi:3-oxoacyl-(acyl-carrier-protein) synthase